MLAPKCVATKGRGLKGEYSSECNSLIHGPSYLTLLCSDKLEKAAGQERLVNKAGLKKEATVQQVALISVKVRT